MSTVTLTWINPTARTDGTVLASSEIARIDVYDENSISPNTPIGSVTGAGTMFTTGVLDVGDHNFVVFVVDTKGHSSAVSNVFLATIGPVLANPNPATNLTGVINP